MLPGGIGHFREKEKRNKNNIILEITIAMTLINGVVYTVKNLDYKNPYTAIFQDLKFWNIDIYHKNAWKEQFC